MDRVGGLDSLFIGELGGAGGELAAMPGVKLSECARDHVNVCPRPGVRFFEQAAADNLERFPGRGGPPLIGGTADHLLQPGQSLPAVEPANLDVRAAAL
jgi:hypothetical protein